MTDHPRFEPIRGAPDEAHLEYNGGRLVDAVLKLIDWWLAPRESAPPSARGHQGEFNTGKYAQATPMAERALTERRLGPDHPRVGARLSDPS